jgi:hypothetical protein
MVSLRILKTTPFLFSSIVFPNCSSRACNACNSSSQSPRSFTCSISLSNCELRIFITGREIAPLFQELYISRDGIIRLPQLKGFPTLSGSSQHHHRLVPLLDLCPCSVHPKERRFLHRSGNSSLKQRSLKSIISYDKSQKHRGVSRNLIEPFLQICLY